MLELYVDAGTKNNGQRGNQITRICVTDSKGKIITDTLVGDYTNNEGEILACLYASFKFKPRTKKHIFTDSKLVEGWILNGRRSDKKHAKKVGVYYAARLTKFVSMAKESVDKNGSIVTWIPREENKAGWHLEERYGI